MPKRIILAALFTAIIHLSVLTGCSQSNTNSMKKTTKSGYRDKMNTSNELKNKSRSEIIKISEEFVKKYFDTDILSDFSKISVWKKSDTIRIDFALPVKFEIPDRAKPLASTIIVTFTKQGVFVSPQEKKYLYILSDETRKLAKMFAAEYSVSIFDRGDHFEAYVSHPQTDHGNGTFYTGGSEGYSINKQTFEKKMIWHEHPQKQDKGTFVDKDGNPKVVEDFVEMK